MANLPAAALCCRLFWQVVKTVWFGKSITFRVWDELALNKKLQAKGSKLIISFSIRVMFKGPHDTESSLLLFWNSYQWDIRISQYFLCVS